MFRSWLFHHIFWPHGGIPSDLIHSIHLNNNPEETESVVVFDKYHNVITKDHERMRRGRAGEVIIVYELPITSPLHNRDAILKSKNIKRSLAIVLCTFNLGNNTVMEKKDDGVFAQRSRHYHDLLCSWGCYL